MAQLSDPGIGGLNVDPDSRARVSYKDAHKMDP